MSFGGYEYSPATRRRDRVRARSMGSWSWPRRAMTRAARRSTPRTTRTSSASARWTRTRRVSRFRPSFTNYRKTSLDIMAPGSFVWGLFKPDLNPDPSVATTGYCGVGRHQHGLACRRWRHRVAVARCPGAHRRPRSPTWCLARPRRRARRRTSLVATASWTCTPRTRRSRRATRYLPSPRSWIRPSPSSATDSGPLGRDRSLPLRGVTYNVTS